MPHVVETPFGAFRMCRRCGIGAPEESWDGACCPECGQRDRTRKLRQSVAVALFPQIARVERRTNMIGIGVGYGAGRQVFIDSAGVAWQAGQLVTLLLAAADELGKIPSSQYVTTWPPMGAIKGEGSSDAEA